MTRKRLNFNQSVAQSSILRFTPLFVLVLLVANFFSSCHNSLRISEAIKNNPYIYVETSEGETIEAKAVAPLHREEAVLANFAEQWLVLAFSWHNLGGLDQYYVKERGVKYPYPFYLASLLLKPGYRESYLKLTQEKYQRDFSFSKYISGQYQSLILTSERPIVSPVKNSEGEIIKGVWDVKIISFRTHSQGKSIIAQEVFNRKLRLKAIKPVSNNEKKIWGNTELGQLLQEMFKQGLQVIEVTEF